MLIKEVPVLKMDGKTFIKPGRLWGWVYDPPNKFTRVYAVKPLHFLLRKWYKIKTKWYSYLFDGWKKFYKKHTF
jgi:hypothetical protein